MHITDLFASRKTTLSFEFFPPKTAEGTERLRQTISELQSCAPSFVSLTYGAGGSTREQTYEWVARLRETTALDPIPHLTCVGHHHDEIATLLARYAAISVSNLLALRGDLAPDRTVHGGTFARAAELVRAIRKFHHPGERRGFGIGVAGFCEGHPETPNRLREMDYLKAKVEAGADYICTQLFFDNRDFYDFRERCELAGIRVPIIAGILPVTNLPGLHRMAELAGGARFPARLLRALAEAQHDPEAVRQIGLSYATEQCADLIAHEVAGLHFYTLNQSAAVLAIHRDLQSHFS